MTPCIGLLEDDPLIRRAWCESLEASGYRVLASDEGQELLARFSEVRPNLVVLDMLLPGTDGFEFLARLRADARWQDVPVLIVSELADALNVSVDAESTRALGIAGILPKSVPVETLLDRVARLSRSAPRSDDAG